MSAPLNDEAIDVSDIFGRRLIGPQRDRKRAAEAVGTLKKALEDARPTEPYNDTSDVQWEAEEEPAF